MRTIPRFLHVQKHGPLWGGALHLPTKGLFANKASPVQGEVAWRSHDGGVVIIKQSPSRLTPTCPLYTRGPFVLSLLCVRGGVSAADGGVVKTFPFEFLYLKKFSSSSFATALEFVRLL